jgi:hypothetical protein
MSDSPIPVNGSDRPARQLTPVDPGKPPPLMSIDQPNPPNVVITNTNRIPNQLDWEQTKQTNRIPNQFSSPPPNVITSYNENENNFMLNTRQIVTASRSDPEMLLAGCANNRDIDDVDLDRMYLEAMMEDYRSSMSR